LERGLVVAQEAKSQVAVVAQQPSDLTALVVMIDD
jgi:hypothetical protein